MGGDEIEPPTSEVDDVAHMRTVGRTAV